MAKHYESSCNPTNLHENDLKEFIYQTSNFCKKDKLNMIHFILKVYLICACFFLFTVFAYAEEPYGLKTIYLYDSTRTDKLILKFGCYEALGKNNPTPQTFCYDENQNLQPFDRGKKWQLIDCKSICLRNKITDSILTQCLEIKTPSGTIVYMRFDDAAVNYKQIDHMESWEVLAIDNPDCQPSEARDDVPKGGEIDIDLTQFELIEDSLGCVPDDKEAPEN